METKTNYRDLLNETSLFAGVSAKTLNQMVEDASAQEFSADELIYQPGDDAIDIFLLKSGLVRFSLLPDAKDESHGTLLRSRTIFGWAALIPEHPRRLATAKCIGPATLLVMNGDSVLEALRNDPSSGFKVMERLCSMIARNFIEERNL